MLHAVPLPTPANSNSPKFVTHVRMKYVFEQAQLLLFQLHDVDSAVASRKAVVNLVGALSFYRPSLVRPCHHTWCVCV